MRISDLSSDACSSDLIAPQRAQQIVAEEDGGGIYLAVLRHRLLRQQERLHVVIGGDEAIDLRPRGREIVRSEEHTSELQSLMRISYAVFCLKKKTQLYNILKHTVTNSSIQIRCIHTNN